MDESTPADKPPRGTSPRRKLPPWWRWNLVTLALVLFVLMWTREVMRYSPSTTGMAVATVFAAWYLIPSFITAEAPWPLGFEPRGTPNPSSPYTNRRARRLAWCAIGCRLAALFFLVGGALTAWLSAGLLERLLGRFSSRDMLRFVIEIGWPIGGCLALSLALYTLSQLAADAAERRRHR